MSGGVGCRCLLVWRGNDICYVQRWRNSTDAVTVPVCLFDVAAGSDCASATTKDGSVHTDLTSELSKSSAITNTAITAAKRYRINFHPWCVKAGRIEVRCGHFADELRQRRCFLARKIYRMRNNP